MQNAVSIKHALINTDIHILTHQHLQNKHILQRYPQRYPQMYSSKMRNVKVQYDRSVYVIYSVYGISYCKRIMYRVV